MTAVCDGPFGAVSELDRPSWFTALPQSVKCIAALSIFAVEDGSITNTAHISPLT